MNHLEKQISLYEPSRKSQSLSKQKEVKIKLQIEKEDIFFRMTQDLTPYPLYYEIIMNALNSSCDPISSV